VDRLIFSSSAADGEHSFQPRVYIDTWTEERRRQDEEDPGVLVVSSYSSTEVDELEEFEDEFDHSLGL